MWPRQLLQPDGNLRHSEQDVDELQRGTRGRLLQIPHQHVGMSCRIAADQPDIYRLNPVLDRIIRAVSRPEHIAVFAHQGAGIALAEFDQNVRLQAAQPGDNSAQQPVYRHRHRGRVASAVRPRSILRKCVEAVDEIQLKPVQIPLQQRLLIDAGQIFPHLRITRIGYPCAEAFMEIEQFVLVALPYSAELADERNRIPQHIFQP
ncbi:hypothetical protein D3C75_675450 [compost metagenome]